MQSKRCWVLNFVIARYARKQNWHDPENPYRIRDRNGPHSPRIVACNGRAGQSDQLCKEDRQPNRIYFRKWHLDRWILYATLATRYLHRRVLRNPRLGFHERRREGEGDSLTTEEELAQMQKKYDALVKETDAARTFGTPSPQRGKVHLGAGGAESEAGKEYLELEADWGNSSPISISSWSLQSALTGVRAYIPRGANLFGLGYINEESDVYLNPGATAIVSSVFSPVGISFRENICVGYIGRLQTFVPRLSSNCPLPSESLPLTPDNLQTYGDACFDFVQTLPSCALPRETPPEVSSECRIFLSNTISYNGCVEQYRHRSDFLRAAWRIYLGADGELWRNTHDVIRLLDSEGRTVDVVSY